MHGNMNVK